MLSDLAAVMTTEAVEQPVQEQQPATDDKKAAEEEPKSQPTQEDTSPAGGSGTDSDSEGSVPELEEHDAAIQQMQSQVFVTVVLGFRVHQLFYMSRQLYVATRHLDG